MSRLCEVSFYTFFEGILPSSYPSPKFHYFIYFSDLPLSSLTLILSESSERNLRDNRSPNPTRHERDRDKDADADAADEKLKKIDSALAAFAGDKKTKKTRKLEINDSSESSGGGGGGKMASLSRQGGGRTMKDG